MAELKNYLGMRGRVGELVVYKLGDKTFIRKRAKRNESSTEEQQAVRSRFRVAVRFYQKLKDTPLKRVLNISAQGRCISGYAFFMKVNLKVFCADGKIGDCSQLQFAVGKRQKGYNWTGVIDRQGKVALSWGNSLKGSLMEGQDQLGIAVIHEGRSFSPEFVEGVNTCRKDGKVTFRVTRKDGKRVHVYCFFISPDEKQLSTSQYVCLQEKE